MTKKTVLTSDDMIHDDGSLYRMTPEQSKRAYTLLRNNCCNYDQGNCKMLDDGDLHHCPQLITLSVNCKWFREAILPLNTVLENEIFCDHTEVQKPKKVMKHCDICSRLFKPKSARTKHCPDCAIKARRKSWSQSQRKNRSVSTIPTNTHVQQTPI